jgi:hypothetical protein
MMLRLVEQERTDDECVARDDYRINESGEDISVYPNAQSDCLASSDFLFLLAMVVAEVCNAKSVWAGSQLDRRCSRYCVDGNRIELCYEVGRLISLEDSAGTRMIIDLEYLVTSCGSLITR